MSDRVVTFGEGPDQGRALVREPSPDDLAFVHKSWLRSQRQAPAWRAVDALTFNREYGAVVGAVLKKPGTRALVACDEQAPSTIYGFAVWTPEPMALHIVYVWGPMRGLGLGRALVGLVTPAFGEVELTVTATTPPYRKGEKGRVVSDFSDLAGRCRLRYDPFVLMGPRA